MTNRPPTYTSVLEYVDAKFFKVSSRLETLVAIVDAIVGIINRKSSSTNTSHSPLQRTGVHTDHHLLWKLQSVMLPMIPFMERNGKTVYRHSSGTS